MVGPLRTRLGMPWSSPVCVRHGFRTCSPSPAAALLSVAETLDPAEDWADASLLALDVAAPALLSLDDVEELSADGVDEEDDPVTAELSFPAVAASPRVLVVVLLDDALVTVPPVPVAALEVAAALAALDVLDALLAAVTVAL